MNHTIKLIGLAFTIGCLLACSSTPPKKRFDKTHKISYKEWTSLTKGMEFKEIYAPLKSQVGDSKLSILRIEPEFFEFDVYSATKYNSIPKTIPDWAKDFGLIVAFNAGMFSQENPLQSRAYLKSGGHINNGELLKNFNLVLALSPKASAKRSNIEVLDLTCDNWEEEKNNFSSFAQGLRMIDCNSNPTYWQKKKQSCSMLVAAEDEKGRFYLIFTRSPYSQNQMIDFILQMPERIHNVIYLEGGPETSLFIHVNEHHIERIGSWVSDTWESDTNSHFWELPNIIGIRKK